MTSFSPGLPGIQSSRTATPRRVFFGGDAPDYFPGGKIIDGSKARDSGNTGDLDVLRAGVLMGKITTGGKYAPSIIGVTTQSEVALAGTFTISAAQAVELNRRVTATGTVTVISPPAANGVVATWTEVLTAINTTSGLCTISGGLNAAIISGAFIAANDGSQTPMAFIADEYGLKVTDVDGVSVDVPYPRVPIGGVIESAQLLPWPTDTSLQNWIIARLNDLPAGKFVFSHPY